MNTFDDDDMDHMKKELDDLMPLEEQNSDNDPNTSLLKRGIKMNKVEDKSPEGSPNSIAGLGSFRDSNIGSVKRN